VKRNRHLHPRDKALVTWLEGEAPEYQEHIELCLRCSNRLEELVGEEAQSLVQALSAAVAPPENLAPRLQDGISRRMQARADWSLVGDLVGVSWRTVRVLSQGTGLDG